MSKGKPAEAKYYSPVGKLVVLQNGQAIVGTGIVLHQTAHVITLQTVDGTGHRGQVQWFGWGPGMVMFEKRSFS